MQKTAYDMRISDWSSDVCSSDLAAYIVCAYLTGMRDCEVQAMRRGCLSIARSEDGLIERQRVRSTLYKRRSSAGESASWVTIEPVAEAITVLERLSEHAARKTGSDTLWPVLRPRAVTKTHLSSEEIGRAHV